MKTHLQIPAFVVAILSLASASGYGQQPFALTYVFGVSNGTPNVATASFDGTQNGNLITSISNVSVAFNGSPIGSTPYLGSFIVVPDNGSASGTLTVSQGGGSVVSFDGTQNNFTFQNLPISGSTTAPFPGTNYLYSLTDPSVGNDSIPQAISISQIVPPPQGAIGANSNGFPMNYSKWSVASNFVNLNTAGSPTSPYYLTSDGTVSGTPTPIVGPTQVINTAGYNVLTGANSYTGTTTVNGGTLAVGEGSSLQSNVLISNSSSFVVAPGGSVSGTGYFYQTSGSTLIAGSFTQDALFVQGGNVTITGAATLVANLPVNGSITIAGGGSIVDPGYLGLGEAGGAGTLNIGADAESAPGTPGFLTLGYGISNGSGGTGTVQFNTTNTANSPYYFSNDGTANRPSILIGGSTQIINTAGFNILSGPQTYTGATTINGGTLEIGPSFFYANSSLQGTSAIINNSNFIIGSGSSVTGGAGAAFTQNTAGSSTVLEGGSLNMGSVNIGAGQFGGMGSVTGDLSVTGGTISVGASPDTLAIHGNYSQTGGSLVFEVDPNGSGGFLTSTLQFDSGNLVGITDTTITFDFLGGADPTAFFDDGLFNLNTFFTLSNGDQFGSDYNFGTVFGGDTFALNLPGFDVSGFNASTGDISVIPATSSVPDAASTMLLSLIGLAAVGMAARRQPRGIKPMARGGLPGCPFGIAPLGRQSAGPPTRWNLTNI